MYNMSLTPPLIPEQIPRNKKHFSLIDSGNIFLKYYHPLQYQKVTPSKGKQLEIFDLWFFTHQANPPGPRITTLNYFQIHLDFQIRGMTGHCTV
jgi:hypothetical protein